MSVYYVDQTTGDDADTGLTEALAWKTVAKVNASSFSAGDSILFKRGETWREQLTVPSSGSAGHPITFGAYGTGNDPIINGADIVGTWTAYSTSGTIDNTLAATNDSFYGKESDSTLVNHGTNLYWGLYSSAHRNGGFRFQLNVPQGATITAATTSATVSTGKGDGAVFEIYADDADNSSQITTWNGWTTAIANKTTATESWDLPATTTGVTYTSPDISSVVQEIVSRPGWVANNYIGLLFDDSVATQEFVISTHPNGGYAHPVIHVEYDIVSTTIWKASLTTEPSQVFFDGTRGTKVASAELCNSANKWYWAANVLYVYSTSDPDTAFTTPGIEASIRTMNIYASAKTYITIQDITSTKANQHTSYGSVHMLNSNPCILDSLTCINNDGLAGIFLKGTGNGSVIQDCTVSYQRSTTEERGYGILVDGAGGGHTIQDCICHHNNGDGIKEKISTITEALTIKGCTVYQNGCGGIVINGDGTAPSDCIIEHNHSYENGQLIDDYWGIDLFKCGDDNIIRYNLVHDNHYIGISSGGIRLDANPDNEFGTGTQIYYNIIYNERDGIQITAPFDSLYNNVFFNIEETAILINDDFVTSGAVKNNITHTVTGKHVRYQYATGVVFDYNCYYGGAGNWYGGGATQATFALWKAAISGDANSLNADPKFVDAAGHDFHLQSGSPCINAGTNVGLTVDYAGNPVGLVPDIGAYEYAAVAPTLAATTAASSIAATTATSGGNVTDQGDATVTARGVCWNTSTGPTTANSKTTDAGTTGAYSSSLTGLTRATKYYVRSYATNTAGTGYGAEVDFTTLSPTITSLSDTTISIGQEVTITGTSFGTTEGTVKFNGTLAAITTWSDTSIVVTVPAGTTAGNVIVYVTDAIYSAGSAYTMNSVGGGGLTIGIGITLKEA